MSFREQMMNIEKDMFNKVKSDPLFAAMAINHGMERVTRDCMKLDDIMKRMPDSADVIALRAVLTQSSTNLAICAISCGVVIEQLRKAHNKGS